MSETKTNIPKGKEKRYFKKRSPYHKMAKIKRVTTGKDGKPKVGFRPFVTGAKGQSHDGILANASRDGFEYGEEEVDYHLGQNPEGTQNEIHGGPKFKCARGCVSKSLVVPKLGVQHSNNYILATPAIDTRQEGSELPSVENMRYFTLVHIRDVQHLAMKIVQDLVSDVLTHDWTKLDDTEMFLNNFAEAKAGKNFLDGKWWAKHRSNERHHPIDYTGDHKPNLTDVLHMLCDWIAAGNARGFKGVSIEDSLKRVGSKINFKDFLYDAFVNSFEELNAGIVVERGYERSNEQKSSDVPQELPKSSTDGKIIETEPSKEFLAESAAADAVDGGKAKASMPEETESDGSPKDDIVTGGS
jgi:hypothetical protein